LVKSLTLPIKIKHYKKFHNFWTSLDRRNRKQNANNAKKTTKEIVNERILLQVQIDENENKMSQKK